MQKKMAMYFGKRLIWVGEKVTYLGCSWFLRYATTEQKFTYLQEKLAKLVPGLKLQPQGTALEEYVVQNAKQIGGGFNN